MARSRTVDRRSRIGVGRNDWFRSPLPPNRTGGSPASGSPVKESPRKGLTGSSMGVHQGKQPLCCEKVTGPLLMGGSKAPASFAESTPEDAPQSHAHPLIDRTERGLPTVLEVFKPAAEESIQVVDNDREALPVDASRFLTHRVFELLQAFLPRQLVAPLEVIAEKVKAARVLHIHEMRFLGMQPQARRLRPALHEAQRLRRLLCRATQDDKVVGVSHHLEARRGHRLVERVEIQIGEQGTDHAPYAKGNFQFDRMIAGWREHPMLDLRRK
jgi:hypothetical protein